MLLKKITTSIFFLFCMVNLQAQDNYSTNWKKVEQHEKNGLTRSALEEVIKIFNMANSAGNSVQQIKSAMYQMKYRNMVEEDNRENNIFYLDTLIAKTKQPAKNILQSMQAELFWMYRQNNRHLLYSRTELAVENSKDITTWTTGKLNATIAVLYKASLTNEQLLKSTPLNGLDAILTKGKNTRQLRPTLYDLLAHRALDYFMNDENNLTQPAYKFILNDERIFDPASVFADIKFTTKDTASLFFEAIKLFQNLIHFHEADKDPSALIDADLKRLHFMHQHGVITGKFLLYDEALKNIADKFSSNPSSAQATYLRALLWNERGNQYNPFAKKDVRPDIKKAAELAESAFSKFPKSEGGINAKNLLNQIKQPSLELETEKVNIPGQAFRSLVKYRNAQTVYFRIIKTTKEAILPSEEKDYDAQWKNTIREKTIKEWKVNLPGTEDLQEHSTEIKIDALPAGIYIILAGLKPDFSLTDNILAKQLTYVSSISFITNDKREMFVVNRDNGQPLQGAEVQLWESKYNYISRKNEQIKREKYKTDANGYVKIAAHDPGRNYTTYQINYKNDELHTFDQYYNYSYNSYLPRSSKQTFVFTDRAIYRPEQEVFFKGIVIYTDSASKKSNILAGFKTTIILYDANNQKAGQLLVTTNEYGSYNGSFKLPPGVMNGQFRIFDSVTKSSRYISVEEYKRPKFITSVARPEGTYKVNDTILIKGNAKAYAGNNIDNGRVTYRVVRKIRYPILFGYSYKIFPPFGNNEQMEITNGITETDSDGNFIIKFRAIPDETVDKANQPVFHYEVTADVTDINGETRSGNTTVAVSYQAIKLNIEIPEKITADSINSLKVTSTNLNDLFEKTIATLNIFKLQTSSKIYRERYWNAADQFVMTKEEYYAAFPHDIYADEDQVSKWNVLNKVSEITDSTKKEIPFTSKISLLQPGWYKITVTTKDKYGEEVKAEKYIEVTGEKQTTAPVAITINKTISQPGEKISYSILTGFDKIWLIHKTVKASRDEKTTYPVITANSPFNAVINVEEADRGGMYIDYTFIKHNRVYTNSRLFEIPWSNKELIISYETFRDKILPGSEEKWKVKLTGNKGEKAAAEMLVSMYDASLDQFKPHSWNDLKSIWPKVLGMIQWSKNTFAAVGSEEYNRIVNNYIQLPEKSYDELLNNGWNEMYYYRRMDMMSEVVVSANGRSQTESKAPAPVMRQKVALQGSAAGDTVQDMNSAYKTEEGEAEKPDAIQTDNIEIRKNFNETAFFFPALYTDAAGNVEFSFTIPEALTQWKLMTFAHTKDLSGGYSEKTVTTQKPLMVQPNAPRFVREGDRLVLVTKVVNMNEKDLTGKISLDLLDASTNNSVSGLFKNSAASQSFEVKAGQSMSVSFPLTVPSGFNSVLIYRLRAITDADAGGTTFSDGEEAAIPVLTNRMLVTETLPLPVRNTSTKTFKFDKLLNSSSSSTLTHHAFTVEYTSNPAWYAVQALPYLIEYPYECAEQNFNKYYANTLAGFISNSNPRIKAIFDKWKITDTAALLSNLQKNEELKSVLLEETPWVMDALNEAQQKKNIALLFDMVKMASEKNRSLSKLKEMQSSNGGFVWFKGGPDDRYITQYILSGIGHLKKLKAFAGDEYVNLKPIADKAIPYLDLKLKEEYDNLVKLKVNLKNNNLSYTAIQYLYMRSFFTEYKISSANKTAYDYFAKQAVHFWLSQTRYMQGMIALHLHRSGDLKTAKAITASLKQNAIYSEEMGMYWKEFSGGYFWHQAPVESQALMIEAFTDIEGNISIVNDMKTWLLKQKQTQNWRTTKATAEACYALLLNGSDWLSEERIVVINAGNTIIRSDKKTEAGTGYFKETIPGKNVQQGMGNINVSIVSAGTKAKSETQMPLWGAAYWQYFEQLDKITFAATPLKVEKKLFVQQNSDRGPVLKPINNGDKISVGDKVIVRIELKVDRDMEYVHMKDMRAAAMEPVNVLSSYKYQGGLGYYESTKDASTNFFFNRLPRGSYVFEYPVFVSHTGDFSNGITTIQCMYAPEFTSHSEGIRVNVQ